MWRLGYMSVWGWVLLCLVMLPSSIWVLVSGVAFEFEWELMSLGGVSVSVGGLLDVVSLVFGSCVLLIGSSVFMFGQGYMSEEIHMARFTVLLVAFVLSMGLLIFSSGIVSLLLGWDGLGLSSFLLVIYYQSATSAGGGLVTVLSNRIGDVALILGLGALLVRGDFSFFGSSFGVLSAWLVVVGGATKSAQVPFSAWLPLAMAAPTPVSALVHSSTLVTAGVFMIIRCYGVVGEEVGVRGLMLFFGAGTALVAGLAAISEFDGKKVVAFSTLSQLGMMVISLGLGAPLIAFFHLLTHAMFKALLFVCVGCFIYFHEHTQDLRGLGNVVKSFSVAHMGVVVASGALCGVPFLAGFYSKELILEMGLSMGMGWGFLFFLVLATVLTSAYSVRSLLLMHFMQGSQACLLGGGGKFWEFWWSVVILGVGSVVGGASLGWILLPSLNIGPISAVECGVPISLVLGGIFLGKKWGELRWISRSKWSGVFSGLWYLSDVTCHHSLKVPMGLGGEFLAKVDQGWVELGVSQGISLSVQELNRQVRVVSGQPVITVMLLGLVGVVFFLMVCVG